jgi:haloalkane dehalogenase
VSEGEGEPIVFVHGNPSWSFESRNVIKALSKHFRCIAMDHLGFGLSDKPWNYAYLPQDHASNLEALLESLHLTAVTLVVGDWGGPIGLSYAMRHPQKIKSIVITNTWLWSVENDLYYRMFSRFMGGRVGRWLIRKYNFYARVIVPMAYGDRSKLTSEIHRHYLKPLSIPEERKGNWVFPKQIIESSGWLDSLWGQRHLLDDKISVIAWGLKDIAFRKKELQTWTSAFPRAKVLLFENSGHFLLEENSLQMAEEITKIM